MPYTLKPNKIFVKNPDGTGYLPQNIITDRATSDTVADIEAAGQVAVDRVNTAISNAQSDIADLESREATIASAIASMSELGTDTTLTVSGMAADAKATGDGIAQLKSAINKVIIIDETHISPEITITAGYVKADGTVTGSGSTWQCSDYIDISDAKDHIVDIKSCIYGTASTVWFADDHSVIGYISGSNASNYGLESKSDPQTYSLSLPATAKYIRVSWYKPTFDSSVDIQISYDVETSDLPGEFLESLLAQKVSQEDMTAGLATKVSTNQGLANSGKFMKVNSSGNIEPQEFRSAETVSPEFETEQGLILNTGEKSGSSGWTCSDFVDVRNAINHLVTIRSTVYGTACTAWYAPDKTFIDYVNGNNASEYGITASSSLQTYDLTLPNNAAYVRLSGYQIPQDDGLSVSYQMLSDAPWDEDIALAKSELEAEIADKADKSDVDVVSEIVGDPKYANLVDPSKVSENTFISGATGVKSASNYYNSTDFIKLLAGKTYFVGNFYFSTNSDYHAFYTEANESTFVSSPDVTITKDSDSHATIIVGDSDVYARFSALKTKSNQYVSSLIDSYAEYPGLMTIDDMLSEKSRFNKVLVLGDSISTDNYGGYKKWVTDLIEEGFLPTNTLNSSQHASGFVARYNDQPNDFITRIKAVANPETFDLVIVFGGINDANQLVPVGTDEDTDYLTYFKPALKEFYRYLCLNFINARIGILLPLPCSTQNRDASVIGVQYTYSDIQRSVAEAYSLPILDLTNHGGFYPDANRPGIDFNTAQAFRDRWTLVVGDYRADGIHPTEEYEKKFLAPMIKKFIESL